MCLAQQESQICRFILVKVGQINLTITIFAFCALLMKYGPIKIYLRIHYVYCLGANLFSITLNGDKMLFIVRVMTKKKWCSIM